MHQKNAPPPTISNMVTKSSPLFCLACFLLLLITPFPEARAQDNSCLNQLSPCLNYLNGNREPPDSCCDPLKSVIRSDPQCLCSLVSNKGTRQAEQAGINITEAQTLPGRCGQRVNPLSCLSSSSPGSHNTAQNSAAKIVDLSQGVTMILVLLITAQMLWV
ncbi:non-specific lipid transfer protein GPI-anchored 30 [Prosopis cineraria]|uniref:non-specific lipid transfer protein GPI-anchored 30 n=1 Tax=Prosopis cineraria TaxID=364024 RepID=UPI00240FB9AB|nr:non-specific lipid transfer protein GPI-anchored 30 [Prosopis cineraria]